MRTPTLQGQALTTERRTIYSIQYFLLVVFAIGFLIHVGREMFGPDKRTGEHDRPG